jgi:hypothetical protein
VALLVAHPNRALTQSPGLPNKTHEALAPILGPVAPEVITRDEQGGVTIRGTCLVTPIRVDGRLDAAVYS